MKFAHRSAPYLGYSPCDPEFPVTEPTYCYDIDADSGEKVVVLCGETNVYEQKQEALKDVLLYNVLDRVQRTGDSSILNTLDVESYVDTLGMPRDLLEAQRLRLNVEQFYDELPLDFRTKEYNNNFHDFLTKVNDQLKNKAIKTRSEFLADLKAKEASNE